MRPWLGMAVGVLALSGVMALLIALARTPLVRPFLSESYFRVALVSHVDLFLVIWYLVIPAVLWTRVGLLGGLAERAAFWAMAGGAGLVAVAGAAGLGRPVLAHYVPYLEHPVFFAGLGLFLAGVALGAGAAVAAGRGVDRPEAMAARAAALCVLGTVLGLAVAAGRLAAAGVRGPAVPVTAGGAGGHLLQFAHVGGALAAWAALLAWSGAGVRPLRVLGFLGYVCAAGVVLGLGAISSLGPGALGGTFFTTLKAWGVGVPAGLGAAVLVAAAWGRRRRAVAGLGAAAVGLAVLGVGGLLALGADLSVQTTLIPGHYHAVLTAVGLAYIGFTAGAVVRAGVRLEWSRLARWQPYLYGLGTLVLVGGMAWAGALGAPRKVAGLDFARNPATMAALAMWGVGALLAEVGGLLYVAWSLATVWRWRSDPAREGAEAAGRGGVRGVRAAGGAGLAAVALAALLGGGVAQAKADLVRAVPAEGAVLTEPPREVVLTYSEEVEARMATVSLLDAQGRIVRGARLERRGPRELALVLPALPRTTGRYYVKATVASARDFQLTDTLYQFQVEAAGGAAAGSGRSPQAPAAKGTAWAWPLVGAAVVGGAAVAFLVGRSRREAGRP